MQLSSEFEGLLRNRGVVLLGLKDSCDHGDCRNWAKDMLEERVTKDILDHQEKKKSHLIMRKCGRSEMLVSI